MSPRAGMVAGMSKHTENINAIYLGNPEVGSGEWFCNREGLTGTKISSVIGSNPYKSAYTLYCEEAGLIPDSFVPNDRTEFGSAVEPIIRTMFAQRNPDVQVIECGQFAHKEFTSFRASPDALIFDPEIGYSILEIKFTTQYWTEPPQHYIDQCLWYMYVLDLDSAVLAAFTSAGYRDWVITRDQHRIDYMEEMAKDFMLGLENEIPPAYDGSDSTYETVRTLSPGLIDGEIELGSLAIELLAVKSTHEFATEQLQAAQSKVLAYMNGTRIGLLNGQPVVKLQARNSKPFITYTK